MLLPISGSAKRRKFPQGDRRQARSTVDRRIKTFHYVEKVCMSSIVLRPIPALARLERQYWSARLSSRKSQSRPRNGYPPPHTSIRILKDLPKSSPGMIPHPHAGPILRQSPTASICKRATPSPPKRWRPCPTASWASGKAAQYTIFIRRLSTMKCTQSGPWLELHLTVTPGRMPAADTFSAASLA